MAKIAKFWKVAKIYFLWPKSMKSGQKVAKISEVAKSIFLWPNSLKSGQISKFWPQNGQSGNPAAKEIDQMSKKAKVVVVMFTQ